MERSELYRAFRAGWLIKVFGFVLICGGTFVLYWNEGQSVNFIVSLDEALHNAFSIDASEEPPEGNFNGRLVHISGPLVVGEPLTEPDYNIDVMAVKLKRRVQMYQHVEESVDSNSGDGNTDSRTYYYRKEWRDDLVDSRSFHIHVGRRNPDRFPIESAVQVADAVFIGNYELSTEVKHKFNNFIEVTSDTRPDNPAIKLHSGLYYHTEDIFNPEVGDVRLLFSFAGLEGDHYTVVGVLQDNKILPFVSSRNVKMILLHAGEFKVNDIFRQEYFNQRLTAWRFRFMGWILVFFGITCISNLVHIVLRSIPIIRSLAPNQNHPICANLLFSTSLFLTIASIVWVIHRPMLAFGLMVAALSPFLWFARGIDYL